MLEAGRGERQPSPRPSGVGSVSISLLVLRGQVPLLQCLREVSKVRLRQAAIVVKLWPY